MTKEQRLELLNAIEAKIQEYESTIAKGDNKGNEIEMFQRGCITGLNLARTLIAQQ